MNKTTNIFDFKQLKKVISDLVRDAMPRKAHGDSKEIDIHKDKLPDKNPKYLIFNVANHITKYYRLLAGLQEKKPSQEKAMLTPEMKAAQNMVRGGEKADS